MDIEGYFEGLSEDGRFFSGWGRDRSAMPGHKLSLAVVVDGLPLETTAASRYRRDLKLAGLVDPAVGFIVRVPDDLRDSAEHEVGVVVVPHGAHIPGSPRKLHLFPIECTDVPAAPEGRPTGDPNLIPNADFLHWPTGLVVSVPGEAAVEVAEGWSLTGKGAQAAVWHPHERFAPPPPFGLALTLAPIADGSTKLSVRIDRDQITSTSNHFSVNVGPLGGANVLIERICIGSGNSDTEGMQAVLARNLFVKGILRFAAPVDLLRILSDSAADEPIFINLSFQGTGTITIFEPSLRPYIKAKSAKAVALSGFESKEIADQIGIISLPKNWYEESQEADILVYRSNATPFTQIIIPVHNAAEHLIDCIGSITSSTASPFELLIVDDGSNILNQEAINHIVGQDPRIRLVRTEHKSGYTNAVNHGLDLTVSDWVVVMNSDVVVTRGWLDKLHEAMRASPNTAAVGPVSNAATWQSLPLVKGLDGDWSVNSIPSGMSLELFAERVEEASEVAFPKVPLLNGFCTLFSKAALETVGYFAKRDFPEGYGEENDLSIRLSANNFVLRIADHCYVYHKKSKSFGPRRRRELGAFGHRKFVQKHPGINIRQLEQQMAECGPLVRLRNKMALEYSGEATE